MRLLLDTHTLIWFVLNNPRLSTTARALIFNPANDILISPATYWEIAIKVSSSNYILNEPYDDFIKRAIEGNNMAILPIEPKHTSALIGLPYHHRDPFDRLIIAQAIVEGIPIVGVDAKFDDYPVTRLW